MQQASACALLSDCGYLLIHAIFSKRCILGVCNDPVLLQQLTDLHDQVLLI